MKDKNGGVDKSAQGFDPPPTKPKAAEVDSENSSRKRATGPRTEAGKKRSRNNSIRHGIFAIKALLIDGESSAQFHSLLQRFGDDESLEGLERALRELAATILWRQARLLRADATEIKRAKQFAGVSEPPSFKLDDSSSSVAEPLRDQQKHYNPAPVSTKTLPETQSVVMPAGEILDRHMRYGRHLMCELDNVVTLIERIRRIRSDGTHNGR